MNPLDLAEPRPLRLLLDDAMVLTRRHLRHLYLPVAVPVATLGVAWIVVYMRWFQRLMSLASGDAAGSLGGAEDIATVALVLVLFLLYLLVYWLAYAAMMAACVDAAAGRPASIGAGARFVLRPRALGTLVLQGLAVLFSLALCCAPVIYVAPLLAFVVPAMMEEGRFGIPALEGSARLAHYNPTSRLATLGLVKVMIVTLVGVLLQYAVSFLVQAPFQIAQQVILFRQAAAGEAPDMAAAMGKVLWLSIPSTALGTLAQVVVALYMSFALALVYFDLRRRREGGDLEAAITELEGGAPPEAPA